MISIGGSAVVPFTARKSRIFCGCLLSSTVKSCCTMPATGVPDLLVTTTSRLMRRFVSPGAGFVGVSDCHGNAGSDRQKRAVEATEHARIQIHLKWMAAQFRPGTPYNYMAINARHRDCG